MSDPGVALDRARVDRELAHALELSAADRAAFLAGLHARDAALGGAVDELLALAEQDVEPFEHRLATLVDDELDRWQGRQAAERGDAEGGETGRRLGAWRVVREIGRGGMSVVYLAERADGAYEQRAAVKRLAFDAGHANERRRFERERQILAALRHPDIARLLDGGLDEEGRPFLVLELVEGEPLDRHCDRRSLALEARLRLFVRVARAVGHAHRNLVVHRDIKPANILVSPSGEVKLLDFGIAALVDPGADRAAPTASLARWLTPAYATPEQVRQEAVTTASDVYQLGLLLFELLAGRRAQEIDATTSFAEIDRVVCERAAPRPSAEVSAASARRLGMTPQALRRRLRGDLDTVVETALRKDPSFRYAGADALADDLERHLEGRALAARGGGRWYRARVFVRRHRWPLAAAATLVLLLAGYAATVTSQAARLRRQMATTERLGGFLAELMSATNPGAGGTPAAVARLLDARAPAMVAALAELPSAQAELETVVGKVEAFVARYPDAIASLRAAHATRSALYGADDARTMESAFWLARVLHWSGSYPEAELLYERQLAWRRQRFAPDSLEVSASLDNLACLAHSRGEWRRAEAGLRDVLAVRARRFGDATATAVTQTDLADLLADAGRPGEAEALYRPALATFRRELGESHPVTTLAADGLGHALALQGRLDAARAELEGALAVRRLLYGDRHPLLAESLRHVGLLAARGGRAADAERLLREAFEMHAGFYRAPFVARAEAEWAAALLARGDRARAEAHATAALARLAALDLPRHPFAAEADAVLAAVRSAAPAARPARPR